MPAPFAKGVIKPRAWRERLAAIWSSAWRSPLDDAESRLTTHGRHVVGHYRLGEALESERANLFGYEGPL